jgi:crotonobetainyl-CoA:carnitine CoA-transferase CaiB-like acyl-CoA transferase
MSLPLEGIRVIDLGRLLPVPNCTMILADLGAEVIRVEDPGFIWGNPPPFYEGTSIGAFNNILMRNKKSLALNLKKRDIGALDVVYKLIETADVLVEGFRPGVTKKLRIDYDSVAKINPSIIYCSITGYGQTGPRSLEAGHDINYLGYTGLLDLNRDMRSDKKEPIVPLIQGADIGGSLFAVIGILSALRKRDTDPEKKGEQIDISLSDCAITMNPYMAAFEFTNTPKDDNILHGSHHPYYSVYRTKDDNFMAVGAIEMKFYTNLCNALELSQYITKQYATGVEKEEIRKAFETAFLSKTQDEWVEIFKNFEACVSPVRTFKEAMLDDHFQQRELFVEENHPIAGKTKNIKNPIKFSSKSLPISSSAPKLGENTKEILQNIGYSDEEIKTMKKKGLFR